MASWTDTSDQIIEERRKSDELVGSFPWNCPITAAVLIEEDEDERGRRGRAIALIVNAPSSVVHSCSQAGRAIIHRHQYLLVRLPLTPRFPRRTPRGTPDR